MSGATTSNPRSRSHLSSAALTAACLCSAAAAWALWYQWRLIRKLRSDLVDGRGAVGIDGKGEGRARERKEEADGGDPTSGEDDEEEGKPPSPLSPSPSAGSLNVVPIGVLSSVFRLCVGTPRQGMLCPNSRGRIDLNRSILSPDSLDALDGYGHVWIVFVFHLNTNAHRAVSRHRPPADEDGETSAKPGSKKQKKRKGKGASEKKRKKRHDLFPSRVSPPALGGRRVGLFSTRTPHRPNPIGFTLCRLDGVEMGGSDRRGGERFCVHVSGIDLVDGTPVLDIKPYVPHYDSVGFLRRRTDPAVVSVLPPPLPEGVSLPDWVATGLDKRRIVRFSPESIEQLTSIVTDEDNNSDVALEFYGPKCRRARRRNEEGGETAEEALTAVRSCIEEVLSVDVRSAWQTDKARRGKFQAERAGRLRDVSVVASAADDAVGDTGTEERAEGGRGEPPPPPPAVVDGEESSSPRRGGGGEGEGECGLPREEEERFCTQQIDNLLIHFTVAAPDGVGDGEAAAAAGSGCDDAVEVRRIERIVRIRGVRRDGDGDGDVTSPSPSPSSSGVDEDVDVSDAGVATTSSEGGGDAVLVVTTCGDGGRNAASAEPVSSLGEDVEPDVALYDPANEEAALIDDPDFKRVSLKHVDADDSSPRRPAPRVDPPREFSALRRYWNDKMMKNTPQGLESESRTQPFRENEGQQQEEEGSVKIQELSTGSSDDAHTKLDNGKENPPSAATTDPAASKSNTEGEAFVLVESDDPDEIDLSKPFSEKVAATQPTLISATKDEGDHIELQSDG